MSEETKGNTRASKSARLRRSPNVTEDKGVSKKEAKSRAWATVKKGIRRGKKSDGGRGKKESKESSRKGGKKGGKK